MTVDNSAVIKVDGSEQSLNNLKQLIGMGFKVQDCRTIKKTHRVNSHLSTEEMDDHTNTEDITEELIYCLTR